jgi:hypothetical protein
MKQRAGQAAALFAKHCTGFSTGICYQAAACAGKEVLPQERMRVRFTRINSYVRQTCPTGLTLTAYVRVRTTVLPVATVRSSM